MTNESGFDATRTSQTHSRLLREGDVLADRYRIEDVIGVGAMGTVYRAQDIRLDVTVALKILHASVARDKNSLERFESELKLARQITHPNVVRIHDIGEHESLSFLSMDLIPGRPLDDILNTEGRLDPARASRIAAGIARGLDAAHAQHVVHRDLKPGNILVDDNDNAVITDFGVARSVASAKLTQTGFFVGTPDYLAPEQARGDTVDGRTDIYALGLILYEMLNGRAPFPNQSLEELVAQRSLGRQPQLTRANFTAPDYLRDIIRKCLQKLPQDRYQTAGEVADDLSAQSASGKSAPGRGLWVGVGVALLVLVILIQWFAARPVDDSPDMAQVATTASTSIAILPFHQDPPDPALNWVAKAAYEALAIELGAISSLNVVSKQRVANTLSDLRIRSGTPTAQIADQLSALFSVDWLITATLINEGDRVFVRTDMIPAAGSGAEASFAETRVDLSKVNEIGLHVATVISDKLSLPSPDLELTRLSDNMEALRAYAIGVDALAKGNSLESIPSLEIATTLDPDFSDAWLELATAYELSGRISDAALAADNAIEKSSTNPRVAGLAEVKRAALMGDFERAQSVLEQELLARPSDSTTQFMLAELTGDQGQYQTAIAMLQTIVESDANHPRAWYLLGKFSIQNGDSQVALNTYLPRALQIQEKLNNPQGQADALNAMGIARHRVGDLEEAESSYAQAANIREDIGDLRGFASSLNNLARLELQLGEFEEARTYLDRGIEVRRQLQDMAGLAETYNIYGVLEEEAGSYRDALQRFRQALQIREERDDQYALGNSYNNIGFSYFMLGEYDNANLYWERAIQQSRKTANPDNEMQAQQGLGQLRLAQGEWNDASSLFLQSLDTARNLGFPDAEAVSLGNLGRVAHHTGRFEAALDSYTESLQILESLNDSRGLVEYLIWRAVTYSAIGAYEQAGEDIDRALSLLVEEGRNEQLAIAHSIKGALQMNSGDKEMAQASFARAQSAASKTGSDTPMLFLAVYQQRHLDSPPTSVQELVETARSIGNASLLMQALMIKARAELSAGQLDDANSTIVELTLYLKAHAPYFDAWRIHELAYQVFAANRNTARATKEKQSLEEERARLIAEAPEQFRTSLAALIENSGANSE